VKLRVRLRFSKLGKVRFTSQRDVARMWERALRRDRFPMAYSAGFSPRPQLSFGLALPTGCESLAEYLDVAVDDRRPEVAELDVAGCPERLGALLPDGLCVTAAAVLDGDRGSLQEDVTSCRWVLALAGAGRSEVDELVAGAMGAGCLPIVRQRKGRSTTDDLRPSIIALEVAGAEAGDGEDTLDLVAELATRPRGVRPAELMAALAAVRRPDGASPPAVGENHGGPRVRRACRTNQWIDCDGSRREPLPEAGGAARRPVSPASAWERAS